MTVASGVLGRRGEELAAAWLRKKGYRIIARNYRTRFGEIDLVARERGDIVFIEVKTRRTALFGAPLEAVDRRKSRHWQRAALAYLAENNAVGKPFRFDAVGIDLSGSQPDIELARDISF